jgi:hypothetical protein
MTFELVGLTEKLRSAAGYLEVVNQMVNGSFSLRVHGCVSCTQQDLVSLQCNHIY